MDNRKGSKIFFAGSISRGKAVAINNFSLAPGIDIGYLQKEAFL